MFNSYWMKKYNSTYKTTKQGVNIYFFTIVGNRGSISHNFKNVKTFYISANKKDGRIR